MKLDFLIGQIVVLNDGQHIVTSINGDTIELKKYYDTEINVKDFVQQILACTKYNDKKLIKTLKLQCPQFFI